jgi:hypothetical protein
VGKLYETGIEKTSPSNNPVNRVINIGDEVISEG